MKLFDMLIGAKLSQWMQHPGSRDDDQWEGGGKCEEDEEEDPIILWAVTLKDSRKAVLIGTSRLLVANSILNVQTFEGIDNVVKALLNLDINGFAQVRKKLPAEILTAIVENEKAEEALQRSPLPGMRAAS